MADMCGDNRFEIIARAKEHLLNTTNIHTSKDEMKVHDSFLFRCWQMGWLDRYDRKTENSSEKPNNCEDKPQLCRECDDYAGDGMYCASNHIVYDFSTSKGNCEPQTDCPWK